MRIGYISASNPFDDRKAWSGTIFKIREALENAGHEVLWVPYGISDVTRRVLIKITQLLFFGETRFDQCAYYYRACAASIDKRRIKQLQLDALFIPNGTQIAAYLDVDVPIIAYGDTTFKLMVNYYWGTFNTFYIHHAMQCERKAYQKCALILKSSQWSADSVIADYDVSPDKVYVLEYGSNTDIPSNIPPKDYDKTINVIFSGVDWERKGGDIATETVERLRAKGIDAVLYILGMRDLPDSVKLKEYVKHVGFLNKNIPEEYDKYMSIMSIGHVFLLPTKAECSATVLCEAAGFGMPVFTYDTGGLANYVINDYNGIRLPEGSTSELFAEKISKILSSNDMVKMQENAHRLYNERLSWTAWALSFNKLLKMWKISTFIR